jgi:predicted O-linked N-acetylglucosamine transferase (SPINDLY family)
MAAIDHLVSDAVLSPRASEERASERVLRLPSFPLHELPADAPPVAPLPAVAAGHVTFGSLNNSGKLNGRVLALWAEVLAAVPGARLLIKAQMLASARMAARVRAAFADAGIAADRVEFRSDFVDGRRDLLALYDRIDIGLDTFPYAGGMTTFEAMCQGVPVVTLADRDMVGRWGATLAIHAGHPELVATTPAGYVAVARRLARDLAGLAALRARLRSDFLASPLADARLKARHLERAYRRMAGAG